MPADSELGRIREKFWENYAQRHPIDGVRSGWAASNTYHYVDGARVEISLLFSQSTVGIYIADREIPKRVLRERSIPQGGWLVPKEERVERANRAMQYLHDQGAFADYPFIGGAWRSELVETHNPDNWDAMADWLHANRHKCQRALEGFSP